MGPLFWASPILWIPIVYSVWVSFYYLLNVLWDPGYLGCADLRFLQTLDSMQLLSPRRSSRKTTHTFAILFFQAWTYSPLPFVQMHIFWAQQVCLPFLLSSFHTFLLFPPLYLLASMIVSSPNLLCTPLTLIESLCWYKDNLGNGKTWTWLCLKLCSQGHRDVTVS